MFPFEETDDQLMAIAATKRDMESNKIMDRLICGDVGYGKTEVAIRAHLRRCRTASRLFFWCRRRFWRSSTTIPLCSG